MEKNNVVDVLNKDFVDLFIEKFNVKHTVTNYGANKCPYLNRLLSNMYKDGILDRCVVGIPDSKYLGFPSWIYSYSLKLK